MPSTRLDDLTREDVRGAFDAVEERNLVIEGVEFRESGSGDGSYTFTGYAAVFDTPTTLYDGDRFRWVEIIDARAFDDVMAGSPDVHLNINHDMGRVVARTKAPGPMGKLDLSTDAHGLRVHARLDPADPDVEALAAKMRASILDEMSFAFTVKRSGVETRTYVDDDGVEVDEDRIVAVNALYDVSAVARGAYSTTEASLRTLLTRDEALAQRSPRTPDGAADDPQVTGQADGAADDLPVDGSRSISDQELIAATLRFPRKKV